MSPRAHSSTTAACSASGRPCRTLLEDVDELLRNVSVTSPTSTRSSWAPVREVHEHADRPRGRAGSGSRSSCRSPASRPWRRLRVREGVYPVVDARRREVFVLGPRVLAPTDLELEPGRRSSGAGRSGIGTLEAMYLRPRRRRRDPPPARPLARRLASEFPAAEEVAPLYVRSRRDSPEPRMNLELRRLEQRDLDTVEVIEQASARPRGHARCSPPSCESRAHLHWARTSTPVSLVGYAFVSRYVDAWHVMNVAVAPEFVTTGNRDRAPGAPVRHHRRRSSPRLHPRGASLERGRHSALRATRVRGPRYPPQLLHRQP